MAVQTGWVGTSAKEETGKAWMSEARLELRLPKAGWMSEMIGQSTEVRFINTVNRTQANIHTLMGSPTEPNIYIFENNATISAATQNGWALQTGTFPAGSTLTIINRGHIRGGGGNGGGQDSNAGAGGTALILNFPTTIDNTTGTIWGGGGGGGCNTIEFEGAVVAASGGGGGAGIPGGAGGSYKGNWGGAGTATSGGSSDHRFGSNGRGGAPGAAGNTGEGRHRQTGGRGGYSVQGNGNAVTWIAVGDRRGAVV